MYERVFADATHLPELLRNLLTQQRINTIAFVAKKLAKGMADSNHGYITSAGLLSDCLLAEAALKAKELARVSAETEVPTIFGILTVDTLEQGLERAGMKGGGRGYEAAQVAIEMADLMTQSRSRRSRRTRKG